MTARTPIKTENLAELYDMDEMSWDRAAEVLSEGAFGPEPASWLGTVGADGRPHVASVGIVVHDGDLYFTSGTKAYKTKNLEREPRATIATRLDGIDLSFEGRAAKVADRETVEAVAALYAAGGWPAKVADDRPAITAPYSAQSAGPGPWDLYRFTVEKVVGVATAEPFGASRWTFAAA
jgi:predicted pyridoxine 5'-phosphate oxidase superfamily flavin-nucleotide-binding protein